LIDVGTGAGFPGIPLKIVRPDLRLTLLESTGKKTKFLSHVVKMLGLQDVIIVTARAEEAGQNPAHRQRYDVAVARAVAKLPVLVEYLLPLVRTGGMMIAQKGQHPQDELNMAQRAIGILGGASPKIQNVVVPGIEADRHLVIIKKQKSTRKQYPRRPGVPNKEPL
jgi:16S rRNA (guanine527-N7)-methyltransferase